MFKNYFIVVFFFLGLFSPAQEKMSYGEFLMDSFNIIKPKLLRPQIRIDSKISTFEGQRINIYGYDAGIIAKEKLRLALGYYRINTDLPAQKEIDGVKTNISLVMNCVSLNTELVFFNSRFISVGFPFELAFGEYHVKHETAEGRRFIQNKDGYLGFSNFGLSLTFKPIRFIGLKGTVGYRKSLYPDERTFPFNGVFSSIGLNLDVHEVIRDIKMYRLKKKYYGKEFRGFETFVDLLTD